MPKSDALFWLNDRRGQLVDAEIQVRRGDFSFSVFHSSGILSHWREGPAGEQAASREDLHGLYALNDDDATLDLSELPEDASVSFIGEDEDNLLVELGEDVFLSVVHAEQ